jgi:hypothetical protein
MPGPVRTVVSVTAPEAADGEPAAGRDRATEIMMGRDGDCWSQARTQASSWRARPSTNSRRRLTAATRTDHHSSLRSTPR